MTTLDRYVEAVTERYGRPPAVAALARLAHLDVVDERGDRHDTLPAHQRRAAA